MAVMFIHVDRASHVPIYLQIKESVRNLITQGVLRPGDRLPSTRQLAGKLGVNRMTVEAAFGQLEADGLISSHVGRGTFVNRLARTEFRPRPEHLDYESLARLWAPLFVDNRPAMMSLPTAAPRNGSKAISFVAAVPGPDLFPAIDIRRCADFVLKRRSQEICNIGSADGLPSLKSYLVRWLAQNGMETSEDEVMITTGCQQSMDLIRKSLIGPGDSLVMENPTYPGAVAALATSSTERLQLPVQEGGPDLRTLTSLLSRTRCKLIYSVPNFHNPTGQTMPLEARRQLTSVASQFRIPIVEDDVFGELRYGGPVLPTLRSLCPELVIYIGSFSKMLSTALRLGWIVAPRPVIRQITMLKQSADLHTNLFIQATMDEFCRRDLLNRHMKRVRRIFVRRRDAMADALRKYFPADARFEIPEGGLSMWVSLPHDCNVQELLRLANEHGVQFIPGSAFYFRSPLHNSLRLSFAAEPEDRIQEGVRILGSLLASDKSWFYINAPHERDRSQLIL
jgi:DNA-binding transcriptional MocR family regulator